MELVDNMGKYLVINGGSSSLKFQLFEMPEEKVIISGYIEKIGLEDSFWTIKINGEKINSDIRNGVVGAIAINVSEPVFESQTKVKLGSKDMSPEGGLSVNKFVGDFIKQQLDNYLHKNQNTVEVMLQKHRGSSS